MVIKNGSISWSINGESQGLAFTDEKLSTETMYPYIDFFNRGTEIRLGKGYLS